jgi:hypothetical protein
LTVVIQLWCNREKGPVFVAMFNPLLTVMVALLAYFVFGENLYVGRLSSYYYIYNSRLSRPDKHN